MICDHARPTSCNRIRKARHKLWVAAISMITTLSQAPCDPGNSLPRSACRRMAQRNPSSPVMKSPSPSGAVLWLSRLWIKASNSSSPCTVLHWKLAVGLDSQPRDRSPTTAGNSMLALAHSLSISLRMPAWRRPEPQVEPILSRNAKAAYTFWKATVDCAGEAA